MCFLDIRYLPSVLYAWIAYFLAYHIELPDHGLPLTLQSVFLFVPVQKPVQFDTPAAGCIALDGVNHLGQGLRSEDEFL